MKKGKMLSLFMAVLLMFTMMMPVTNVSAAEYTSEAVKWGERYSQQIDTSHEGYDLYKIVVPATMKVNLRVIDFYVGDHESLYNGGFDCVVYDESYNSVNEFRMRSNDVFGTTLPEGTYYFDLINHTKYSINYVIEFYYSIETPDVTVSALNKKALNIQAKKGEDSIHGYEVRYRLSGKKWTTKKVEEIENLNTKLTKLKSGKYYSVQVRKYVENESGKKYFSKWSTMKTVKVK